MATKGACPSGAKDAATVTAQVIALLGPMPAFRDGFSSLLLSNETNNIWQNFPLEIRKAHSKWPLTDGVLMSTIYLLNLKENSLSPTPVQCLPGE